MSEVADPVPDTDQHRVVVIGASAGGVETLVRVVGDLPADLAATVCVVLHLAPGSPSALPAILQRAGVLPCRSATDSEPLRDGEVLVAPPDRHLVINDGQVALTVGPRENGHRPSVDVLFRSAAAAAGCRAIGVILSGTRDDGTAGLAVIKARGGSAIVQDPADALYPGMPANALAHVAVDMVVPSDQIAAAIVSLVNGNIDPAGSPDPSGTPTAAPVSGLPAHSGIHPGSGADPVGGAADPPASDPPGRNQPFTSICPECGGVLSEHQEAGVTQWRCRVGHRYSPESLADAQSQGVEAALWAAVRALDDRQALLLRLADDLSRRGHAHSASTIRHRALEAGRHANVVRAALADTAATTLRRVEDSDVGEEPARRAG